MANDHKLFTRLPLEGYDKTYEHVRLQEVQTLAMVSIAIPRGQEIAVATDLRETFELSTPKVGQSSVSADYTLLGLAQDQFFLLFNEQLLSENIGNAVDYVSTKMKVKSYLTDQSDSWVAIRLSGSGYMDVLERMCMIDLHLDVFPVNSVTRTIMEHLGVILLREAQDRFLLLSPRSSAHSFLHAIETSIKYTTMH